MCMCTSVYVEAMGEKEEKKQQTNERTSELTYVRANESWEKKFSPYFQSDLRVLNAHTHKYVCVLCVLYTTGSCVAI